ncbi:hypothetical protein TKK_0005973 [Trichogramma kaykai]|uniref:Essential protein Yae1 N-terminal domain-containing protein n=1 Tax=Trichogramma kaykai TaxID=54128 RepID=A0ABD2XHE8_9HYME
MNEQDEMQDEDTLEIASKTWKRSMNAVSTQGFREGREDGSMSVYQEGFDKGYVDAFKISFILGAYKGFLKQLGKDVKFPEEIKIMLDQSKKGMCYLCANESTKPLDGYKNIDEIRNCQREHAQKIIKIIKDIMDPLLNESKIDVTSSYLNL